MSDGGKIISSIISESNEKIAALNDENDKLCAQMLEEAHKKADAIRSAAEAKIQAQADKLRTTYSGRIEVEKRKALLRARRDEINRAFEEIRLYMLGLDDKAYFDILYRLAAKLGKKQGVVVLNSKDMKRLPKDFQSCMTKGGLTMTLCDTPDDSIDGGFILKIGDIEENMSFSAIMADNLEGLEDLISRELFSE